VIFLDTNLLIRAITRSDNPAVAAQERIAGELIRRANLGEYELTTSEAVLAEVAFILTAKRHYGLSVEDAVARMLPYVRSRGLTLDRPSVVHDALLIWLEFPRLGFVDALGAAYAKQPRVGLATFDADLDRVPGIKRHDLASG